MHCVNEEEAAFLASPAKKNEYFAMLSAVTWPDAPTILDVGSNIGAFMA